MTEQERGIFKYHNGTRDVCADPLAIQRKLIKALNGQDLDVLFNNVDKGEGSLVEDSIDTVLAVTRQAFNVSPLDEDGNGLTEKETWALLLSWLDFMAQVKKNGESTPNLPPSSPESSPDQSTTSNS